MDVVRVGKVGNSIKVTVPPEIMTCLKLEEGDFVIWDLRGDYPTIRKVRMPKQILKK